MSSPPSFDLLVYEKKYIIQWTYNVVGQTTYLLRLWTKRIKNIMKRPFRFYKEENEIFFTLYTLFAVCEKNELKLKREQYGKTTKEST